MDTIWARFRNDRLNITGRPVLFLTLLILSSFAIRYALTLWFDATYTDLCKWDCGWYRRLVEDGYDLEPGKPGRPDVANWAFFPLHPIIAKAIHFTTGLSTKLSLQLSGELFYALAIIALFSLFRKLDQKFDPIAFAIVILANPYIVYASGGYTEPAALFFTAAALFYNRNGNLPLAALTGGLAGITRVPGIFVVGANATQNIANNGLKILFNPRYVFWFLISGIFLASLIIYFYLHVGDGLAFRHIQIAWNRTPDKLLEVLTGIFTFPVDSFKFWTSALTIIAGIIVPAFFIWRRMFDLAVLQGFSLLLPAMTGFLSMPRFAFWSVGTIFALYLIARVHWLKPVILIAFLPLQYFVFQAWMSGATWIF